MNDNKYNNAINNFQIAQHSGIPKFEKLDNWLERESILYKSETKLKKKRYIKLKRGTIVKVDFGINPGSELCNTHFAVTLSKYDNINQETIIVLPLTSKPVVGRIPLNNLIKKELLNYLKKKEISTLDTEELHKILSEYKKYKEFSYAYISQITTISKSRLIYPKNKLDIINKIRCSDDVLNKIDDEIIENITGKKVINIIDKEDLLIKS